MSSICKIYSILFMLIILLLSQKTMGQVYLNGRLPVRIDVFSYEGGGDWGFRSMVPGFDVSFTYKGHRIQIASGKVSEKRFSRKEYPIPSDFQLTDNEVLLDGFPASNYMDYIDYLSSIGGQIDAVVHNVDRGDEAALNKVLKDIDQKKVEIKSKATRFQVSTKFSNRENANSYLERLDSQREYFVRELERLKVEQRKTTIIVGGNSSKNEKKKTSSQSDNAKEKNATSNKSSDKKTSDEDFWGNNTTKTDQESKGASKTDRVLYDKDESFVADSKFKNNLSGVKEGEYFEDGSGNYYKKERGGARKVNREIFEKHEADKIYAQMEQREVDRQQRDAEFKQNWDNISTSFYMMSNAQQGLRDASDLSGHFETIEELNTAFYEKMGEISRMSTQMQQSSTQGIQAYTSELSSASSGYDYSGAVSVLGAVASSIAANNAEKEAREELRRQREEQEAAIHKRQLDALVSIRSEIGKIYTQGGMPLSSHKINVPVLYVFAYGSNKNDWNKNQNVALKVSNVIPVYQYSDGTYPYTSNVKNTFENAGINNPVVIGYFTQKNEAEKYRNSLLEVAPNAKFAITEIAVKVKEKQLDSISNSDVDFWGMGVKDNKTDNKKTEKKKEDDFWNK